jgi:hypothetical protein
VMSFFRRGRTGAILLAVSVLLTLIAYGPVLSFPFLFDDLIHLRWLEGRSALEGWANAGELQHYRPLLLTLWTTSARLFGPHNARPLHLLSLLLHVANASLVGWLASRLLPRSAAACATALFATFPFSYQAIPSPGSQSKPLCTLLVLLSCMLYWYGRSRHRRRLVAASVLPALLAPFAYEAGVTIGGYLILMELLLWRRKAVGRFSPWSLLYVLIGPLFALVWVLVPRSSGTASFPGWEALWQSGVYFAQAFTWPLSLFARPLMQWTGLHDQTATTWVAFPSLILLSLLFWWKGRLHHLLAYSTWYVLSLAVQWGVLPFQYVIDGPRILYTGSVAVALLWADLLAATCPGHRRRAGRVVAGVALTAMVGWSLAFIGQRIALTRVGVSVLSEASMRVAMAKEGDVQLFINLPSWLAPRRGGFALGHEGYTILPSYSDTGLDSFVYANTGLKREVWAKSYPDVRQQWRELIGYHAPDSSLEELAPYIRRADRVWSLRYGEDRLGLLELGGVVPEAPGQKASEEGALSTFGETVNLREVQLDAIGPELQMSLRWQLLQPLAEPYTVFVHLYSQDGSLFAQADGLPIGGLFPFSEWKVGDTVQDVRRIALPEDPDLTEHTIGIGLYRADTGERAPAVAASGESLTDGVFRMVALP